MIRGIAGDMDQRWIFSLRFIEDQIPRAGTRATLTYRFLPNLWAGIEYNPRADDASVVQEVSAQLTTRIGNAWPGLVPQGVDGDATTPIHSLFLAVAVEYGFAAGLAMFALAALALKRAWRTPVLPIAVALIVLASLDLYLWIGPMAWAWWWFLSTGCESRNRLR